MGFEWPALVSVLTLFLLFGVAANVGRARHRYKISPPAMVGHPRFELAYRVQMNTVESTVGFLPALWLFAYYVDAAWAGILGFIWLVARVWYAVAYSQDAAKRGPGFALSKLVFVTMTVGALVGILGRVLH
ncbi:uncharacterized protein NMK_0184 [Novimethylophilus kurashikiensis]|uniref:MAPEG family protein n=1 Tax=Novimethylophilus kurashikiensis TaxID=1825523 RepID=A0A2R5F6W1_9PROT|nr:MAPEG family protein [Novimethylophilus kurashikiensis]GBG12653.1 uncharacterized protein NMK_0184 [Novimethylophilus kurashikiensis]